MGQPIFIFCALRGAMDGLDVVIPRGDPEFNVYREKFPEKGERDLDGFFTLHGRLDVLHNLTQQGEAVFIHAIGTGYEGRSHFDGQRVLQTGGNTPLEVKTGWLNRLAATTWNQMEYKMPAAVPESSLATSGPHDFPAFAETISKLTFTEIGNLEKLWEENQKLSDVFKGMLQNQDLTEKLTTPERIAELAKVGGYDIFYTEFGGFDTHVSQSWPLAGAIDLVDEFLGKLKAALGDRWEDTVFFAASEFGRGFYPNSGGGTDHGIGNAAFLVGGGIKKWGLPKVLTAWPGLTKEKLFQGRDLQSTKSMWEVILAVVCRHFDLDPFETAEEVFPTMPNLKVDKDVFGSEPVEPPVVVPPVEPPVGNLGVVFLLKNGLAHIYPDLFVGTAKDLHPDTPVVELQATVTK